MRSRFCRRGQLTRISYKSPEYIEVLQNAVTTGRYDAVYTCDDEILEAIFPLVRSRQLPLPLAPRQLLEVMFSKNRALQHVADAGVNVPPTVVPAGEDELPALLKFFGLPLVVKGEKGSASVNVRFVRDGSRLDSTFREIRTRESAYRGRPAIQKFVDGPTYCVMGVFARGRPLRICVHRKLAMWPTAGGITAKGVSERPPELLDQTFRAAEALQLHGFASLDFVKDKLDGKFKFLEVNPRIGGSVGLAEHAGVDFFTAYNALARGEIIPAQLDFREGVVFRRVATYERMIAEHPALLMGFLIDSLNFRIRSDFEWLDPLPHIPSARELLQAFAHHFRLTRASSSSALPTI